MELKDFINARGIQAALARIVGVPPITISHWKTGARPVPAHRCIKIEEATNGAVTRKELRPKDWFIIWPEYEGAEEYKAEEKPLHPMRRATDKQEALSIAQA